jgi:ribosomal protein L10
MSIIYTKFDPIEYAKQLRSVGVSQEQAEIQAQAMEKVITDIVTNQEIVTKSDLALAIKELEIKLIKWMLGIGLSAVIAIGGMIAKGFHWL